MPSTNDLTAPSESPSTDSEERALVFTPPTETTNRSDVVLTDVTPARRDWLPELLEELLPWIVKAVREISYRHDPQLLTEQREGQVPLILQNEYDVTAIYGWYAFAAASFTAHTLDTPPAEWPTRDDNNRPSSLDTLVKIATGTDEVNSSIDALEPGPVRLLDIGSTTPRITLSLDESAWRNTQRAQRQRGLQTIAILSKACIIQLTASPTLEQFLHNSHPEWCEEYLTENTNTQTPTNTTSDSDQIEADLQSVFECLKDFTPGGGRLQLLAALPAAQGASREVRDLKNDPELNLSPGTIDRYYRELEQKYGFLAVDERTPSNLVSLTPAGRLAQRLLTEDYHVSHPHQTQLNTGLTDPPQSNTGIVSRAGSSHPINGGQSFENSLAANADDGGGSNIRWLSLDECWLEESDLIHRLATGQHVTGITLVNDRITQFDDGRITYLGCAGEEVHVITQWGGPIPTLGRLGATLLSKHAFNHILTSSRVSPLLSKPMGLEVLRLGRQLGWLSDTDSNYNDVKARYMRVGGTLLNELALRNQDTETWKQICAKAHGLLATATNLYDAAGFDVTIHVRVPDTDQLTRDDARYQRFIDFLKHTVPKNATYNGNSAPRMLLETDGEKLSYRLPVDIDDTDRDAELTANWVITGLDVTSFQSDIVDALEGTSVRQQIANGTETGIRIPIEVGSANTYSGLYHTIEMLLNRIGRGLAADLDVSTLVQLYLRAFGNLTHKSLTCSPFDVAEAILAAHRLAPANQVLTLPLLVQGIGAVTSSKVYPWLPPTAQRFMSSLFGASQPLKRSEILEEADISTSSYNRHRSRLEEAGLLTEAQTHHYEAVVPGQWDEEYSSARVTTADDDVQELILCQKLLDAQIRAQAVASLEVSPSSSSCVFIG